MTKNATQLPEEALDDEEGETQGEEEGEGGGEAVDLDAPSDFITSAMADRLFGTRKPVNKPDISRLADALAPDGSPLFKAGDKIVIERYSAVHAGHPYLDTRTYRVLSIDMATGNTWLYDDSLAQNAGTNWRTAPRGGDVFKFASGTLSSKRKRGRPRKSPPPEAAPPPGDAPKRRRGRPPGAKNRPKDVISAERAERKAARAARRGQ